MDIEQLLKKVAEGFPSDVKAIDELIGQIKDAYRSIVDSGEELTEEQVATVERLAEALEAAQAARKEAEAAEKDNAAKASARAERAAKAAAAFADDSEGADEDAGEDTDENDSSDEDDADEDEDSSEEANDDDAADNAEDKDKDEKVTKPKFAGKARGKKGVQAVAAPRPFSLDHAAPNYVEGEVSFLQMAEAFNAISQGRALRSTSVGSKTQTHFGHIERHLGADLTASDEASLVAAIDHATDETRLEGNSLVAAGGWCAPSETIYDFLPTPSAANLFSLPEISIARGGLRFPVEPDFSALYDATRFHMTEAEAIAGQSKECIEIPCAEMDEVRMEVLWTCVTGNLLSNKGWPELTAKFLENATKGHLHRLSAARLAKVVSESVQAAAGLPGIGSVGTILNVIELHAQTLRQKFRLGNATMEGVAPTWLRAVMRADLAYRDEVLPERVTDAVLDQHLGDRGIRFQWVDDYQPLNGDPAQAGYPDSVKVLMYPAGTFFSSVNNVINLGALYDSAGLSKNQRTEMFVEDGWAVGKRGYESREVTIPLNINGQVGLRVDLPTA